VFSYLDVTDGRVWLKQSGVAHFAGDLPGRGTRGHPCCGERSFSMLTANGAHREWRPACGGLHLGGESVGRLSPMSPARVGLRDMHDSLSHRVQAFITAWIRRGLASSSASHRRAA
jgi:hypothetical protein